MHRNASQAEVWTVASLSELEGVTKQLLMHYFSFLQQILFRASAHALFLTIYPHHFPPIKGCIIGISVLCVTVLSLIPLTDTHILGTLSLLPAHQPRCPDCPTIIALRPTFELAH